jgi:DNA polymerase (family 10)
MQKTCSNQEIAGILRAIGEYLAMQNIPFKPQAYQRAALVVMELDKELSETYEEGGIKGLKQIEGIGQSMAEHIEELVTKGKSTYYESLRRTAPVDVAELSRVEGLGPKSIKRLYEELKIRNLDDLEKAAKSGKIRELRGFGAKAEEKILKGIDFARGANVRFRLGEVASPVASLLKRLTSLKEVDRAIAAGSFRRRKETVGDVDLLAVAGSAEAVMKHFVKTPGVVRTLAEGPTKSAVRFASGLQVDLRVVPKASYGAALNYFTGSKEHNVALRQLAIRHGWKLNEYGLYKGTKQIAGASEEEIYEKLGLDYIEPELRENTGEIQAAMKHALPRIIGYGDLEGDLQVQTDWTDGSSSIEDMAKAAAARGLKLHCDHRPHQAARHDERPRREAALETNGGDRPRQQKAQRQNQSFEGHRVRYFEGRNARH